MEPFRVLKSALAYAEFESSDIAGAYFKLIDSIERDIVGEYRPTDGTNKAAEEVEVQIEEFLEVADIEREEFSDKEDSVMPYSLPAKEEEVLDDEDDEDAIALAEEIGLEDDDDDFDNPKEVSEEDYEDETENGETSP